MASKDETSDHYAFLRQRAVDFVRSQGGAAPEDALVAYVFGTGSAPALWRPLLRQVLATAGDLTLHPDGSWALLPSPLRGDYPLDEFVAIDVETTGLKPLHQRIIEVALIRYRAGREVERFESLVNPARRIPQYVSKLTGISDELVATAPHFQQIAEAVEQFIGSSLIVGHNVGFDLSFLNAELKRLGRPPLVNDRIDVLGLANRLLAGLRRQSLDQIARALELSPRRVHRAGVDAELAAACTLRLVDRAVAAGHTSLDRLKALALPPEPRPRDGIGRGRAVLDPSLLDGVPQRPGVYIMRDPFDRVLYVGKAKNLRNRVRSYFSQPLGYTRKMDGLLESTTRIEIEVTGSELEALLLESQLIRRFQPRFNVAMRAHEHYPFIRIDLANPWPRVTLARAKREDGARYFGPFKSSSLARTTVALINAHFPLRTCPRSFKSARSYGAPCIQLDLGRCLGPCVGRADRDQYLALVRQVVRFLDGEDDVVYRRLWTELEVAAERLDFERARRLRNDLRVLDQVVSSQRALREADQRPTLLLVLPSVEPDAIEVMLVHRGRLWAQLRAARSDGADALATRLRRSWERLQATSALPIDHDSLDEVHILSRWIGRHWHRPGIMALERDCDPDWRQLALHAFALSPADLAFTDQAGGNAEESEAERPPALETLPPLAAPRHLPAIDLLLGTAEVREDEAAV